MNIDISESELLDSNVSFFLKRYLVKSRGRLLKAEEIVVDSFLGRDVTACVNLTTSDSLMIFAKMYLIGDKMYTLCTDGIKGAVDSSAVESFLTSFEFAAPR